MKSRGPIVRVGVATNELGKLSVIYQLINDNAMMPITIPPWT